MLESELLALMWNSAISVQQFKKSWSLTRSPSETTLTQSSQSRTFVDTPLVHTGSTLVRVCPSSEAVLRLGWRKASSLPLRPLVRPAKEESSTALIAVTTWGTSSAATSPSGTPRPRPCWLRLTTGLEHWLSVENGLRRPSQDTSRHSECSVTQESLTHIHPLTTLREVTWLSTNTQYSFTPPGRRSLVEEKTFECQIKLNLKIKRELLN